VLGFGLLDWVSGFEFGVQGVGCKV